MNTKQELLELVIAGANNKKIELENGSIAFDRITHEIEMIALFDLCEYFVLSHRIALICNKLNILRSPGRGSAGCSLVNYCLDITMINPIQYNLPFERFLNPGYSIIPNIDMDIESELWDDLFSNIKSDLSDYLVCKIALKPKPGDNRFMKDIKIMNYTYKIHPTSIVIPSNLKKFENDIWDSDDCNFIIINEFSKSKNIDSIKNNEFDILQLNYLRELKKVTSVISGTQHPYKIDLNDKMTYMSLCEGDLDNIFQFNGDSMKEIIREFKPSSIIELAILYALYRPVANKLFPTLIDNKKNENKIIKYTDPRVNLIFAETYGLLIFQETFMEIVSLVAAFDQFEADLFWRILYSNKDEIKINEFTQKFILGCKFNSNLTNPEILNLEKTLREYAPITFNKSHAICYSIVGFWGAYYKTHYKEVFYSIFNNPI
jgi:DNA polymerase-3 subunit alpha